MAFALFDCVFGILGGQVYDVDSAYEFQNTAKKSEGCRQIDIHKLGWLFVIFFVVKYRENYTPPHR